MADGSAIRAWAFLHIQEGTDSFCPSIASESLKRTESVSRGQTLNLEPAPATQQSGASLVPGEGQPPPKPRAVPRNQKPDNHRREEGRNKYPLESGRGLKAVEGCAP